MEKFQVDADFFLNAAIRLEELVQYLTGQYQCVPNVETNNLTFRMNAVDSIDIKFIVKSDSYEMAASIARDLLNEVTRSVEQWLDDTSTPSSIEDESLLLMPA